MAATARRGLREGDVRDLPSEDDLLLPQRSVTPSDLQCPASERATASWGSNLAAVDDELHAATQALSVELPRRLRWPCARTEVLAVQADLDSLLVESLSDRGGERPVALLLSDSALSRVDEEELNRLEAYGCTMHTIYSTSVASSCASGPSRWQVPVFIAKKRAFLRSKVEAQRLAKASKSPPRSFAKVVPEADGGKPSVGERRLSWQGCEIVTGAEKPGGGAREQSHLGSEGSSAATPGSPTSRQNPPRAWSPSASSVLSSVSRRFTASSLLRRLGFHDK